MTASYDPGTYQRGRAAGMRAGDALRLARWIKAPRLDIDIDRTTTTNRDGFELRIRAESDTFVDNADLGYGTFEDGTEDYRTGFYHPDTPGAIPSENRDSRSQGGGARFYVPGTPRAERIAEYQRNGASRSVALDMACRDEADELDRLTTDYGPLVVVVTVTAHRAGVELGSASAGGIELAWSDITRTDGTEYLADVAEDLIPEVIDEARETLAELAASVPA